MAVETFEVVLVYARPEGQFEAKIMVPLGATVRHVLERARLAERFPEVDFACNRVGVFGVIRALDAPVAAGDRVEVYRPLSVDPKEARRRRGSQRQSKKT
ncbi:MAG: RnfH family protein [Gammaproteobacteria bacterium]|nr:RnfH family protein [Gammaproteobacteria bacterium]